jgi:hypothetical protein
MALAALAGCAALCLAFRYLPMADVPQHYAMVSILLHHGDPAWGFAQRYTFDFFGRPYATVYWLGVALGTKMPLGAAMRIVVAVCTVAPLAGAQLLLVATRRSRVWLLPAIPFAFGSLWHWGFLNFLLGIGMFLGCLALVVRLAERRSRRGSVALGVLALLLLFTHFHGLAMLLVSSPVLVWAYPGARGRAPWVRSIAPLVPAGVAAAAFVALMWAKAEGHWARANPGVGERVDRFVEFLAWGLPDGAAATSLGLLAVLVVAAFVLGGAWPRPTRVAAALGVTLAAQVAMYFALPLNTNTATYVSARHALLVVLLALPLLPVLGGRALLALRAGGAIAAAFGLVTAGTQLACFSREAPDFEPVLAAMAPAKRVATLVFARASACCGERSFPYLHFGPYYQAATGGELSRSFAVVWNVPIRYRADYARYPYREELEWAPGRFWPEDARHFDYVLVRGGAAEPPPQLGLREVTRSGAWALYESTTAEPAQLQRD